MWKFLTFFKKKPKLPKAKQTGENPDYPKEVYYWKYSENPPTWITDNFLVSGFSDTGAPDLIKRQDSGGSITLTTVFKTQVTIPEGGYILWDGEKFFSMSEAVFNFLYSE